MDTPKVRLDSVTETILKNNWKDALTGWFLELAGKGGRQLKMKDIIMFIGQVILGLSCKYYWPKYLSYEKPLCRIVHRYADKIRLWPFLCAS